MVNNYFRKINKLLDRIPWWDQQCHKRLHTIKISADLQSHRGCLKFHTNKPYSEYFQFTLLKIEKSFTQHSLARISQFYVKSYDNFRQTLRNLTFNKYYIIVSFDVISLHPNVSISEVLRSSTLSWKLEFHYQQELLRGDLRCINGFYWNQQLIQDLLLNDSNIRNST